MLGSCASVSEADSTVGSGVTKKYVYIIITYKYIIITLYIIYIVIMSELVTVFAKVRNINEATLA